MAEEGAASTVVIIKEKPVLVIERARRIKFEISCKIDRAQLIKL